MRRMSGATCCMRRCCFMGVGISDNVPVLLVRHANNRTGGIMCVAHRGNIRHFIAACSRSCLAPSRLGGSGGTEGLSTPLKCPECGKRFLSMANLRQHRRSRHLVSLKSPSQEELERLREANARLVEELRNLREANALRVRSASSSLLTSSGESSTKGESTSGAHFFAAVPEGKCMGISMAEVQQLRDHPFRLGTGISEVWCVGVVENDVEMGTIGVRNEQEAEEHMSGLETMQFTLRTDGYRLRRAGQLKMYRNRLTVRVIAPRYKAQKGDMVLVVGTYGLHNSYDLVSKQAVENSVLEAGYVGLLKKGPADKMEEV
ncbi:hypothetical protein MOQ_006619 [Trypanosoma cruzi marinkellei]|uniref:C2H2-type domain-containing protein n=1 Tax=Trypanosoma cruzi marinkellei TaxID=85056 RepID=K2NL45_TRYCR|nr:hypothetical protein MOQ_006619 [Trypanosoma cruzi marinkellei]